MHSLNGSFVEKHPEDVLEGKKRLRSVESADRSVGNQ
jgi:hypothetical protein